MTEKANKPTIEDLGWAPALKEENTFLRFLLLKEGISEHRFTVISKHDQPLSQTELDGIRRVLDYRLLFDFDMLSGISACYEVLVTKGIWSKGLSLTTDNFDRLRASLSDEAWHALLEDNTGRDNDILLTERFVAAFCSFFSVEWYAANALAAHYLHEDDFAFGYLFSELRQKVRSEESFLRGEKVKRSAGEGGLARSEEMRPSRLAVINLMAEYIDRGHSLSRAAHLVARSGLGTSAAANRKLWQRHQKRTGTVPANVPD